VNVNNFSTFLFAKFIKSVAKLSKLGVLLSMNGVTSLHDGTVIVNVYYGTCSQQ